MDQLGRERCVADGPENIQITGTAPLHNVQDGSLFRLYQAYFLRLPDAAGACYWNRTMAAGTSLDQVSDAFASSPEFATLYGSLSNRAFVELVYENVLGRPGEAGGVEFWTTQLDTGARTRGEVMSGFSESPEFVLRTGTLPK